jgi:hypothetical protein
MNLVLLVCGLGIGYLVIGAIRRVWFSPLSKFPGSKLAASTLWNEFYWDVVKRGHFIWRIQDMHEKYGKAQTLNSFRRAIAQWTI